MQRRHCLSSIVPPTDNIVQKVNSDDAPARKRRKLSSLIETPKVPSVADHLTYASQSEPRPCNSRQAAALPPRQPGALPPCQSASLPPPVEPQASMNSARTSQHVLRTRRSSPALIQHGVSSSADVPRSHPPHVDSHRGVGNARHVSSTARTSRMSRSLLTRSRSDVSRDTLMLAATAARGGATVDNRRLSLDTHQLPQPHQNNQHLAAAAYLPESLNPGGGVYPAGSLLAASHPAYVSLPISHPLTAVDLAHYLATPTAPVSLNNPYLVTPGPPSWPLQTVPAAVLAADVLPEYYYGLREYPDGLATYPPAPAPAPPPPAFHASHQQHQYVCPASLPHHQPRPADEMSYNERRRQNVTAENPSSFHMTQLPRDMTQIPRDMTQIPGAGPLLYPSDQRASSSAASRQPFDEMDAFTRHSADTRDWSTLTRSSERAQPLFVQHFLSMLESTLGAVHDSPQHLPSYAASHFRNYEALLGLARQLSESKPKGLCKSDIDRLASFQFTATTTNHLSAADGDAAGKQSSGGDAGAVTQTSCVVCMSEFVNRQRIRELPCQHIFHLKCIDKWLKTNRTCPLCRADVLDLLNSDTKPFIR